MSNYLPEELLIEIFLRLPKRSLLQFRCVSKTFCLLIDSCSYSYQLINMKNDNTIVLFEAKRKKIYTIDYKSVSSLLPLSTTSTSISMCDCHEIVDRIDYPCVFLDYDRVECLCSCDDLSWMSTIKGGSEEFYIWDTITKGCKKIPMPPEVNYNNLDAYGFVYDSRIGDYKLIMVVANQAWKCSDVEIYTLRLNSWKRNQSIPYSLSYDNCCFRGVSFQGGLHWLAHAHGEEYVYTNLVRFDIVNEIFVALPAKPLEESMFITKDMNMSICVSGGYLCLLDHVSNVSVDVWIMQEYGVRESWTKIFSTSLEIITSSAYSRLIWNFNNNATLWVVDGDLILYDRNNKIYRKLKLDADFAESVTVEISSLLLA